MVVKNILIWLDVRDSIDIDFLIEQGIEVFDRPNSRSLLHLMRCKTLQYALFDLRKEIHACDIQITSIAVPINGSNSINSRKI